MQSVFKRKEQLTKIIHVCISCKSLMFLDNGQAQIQVEQVVISNPLDSKENKQHHPVLLASHTCHWGREFLPTAGYEEFKAESVCLTAYSV